MNTKLNKLIKGIQSLKTGNSKFVFQSSESKYLNCKIQQLFCSEQYASSMVQLLQELKIYQSLPSQILGKRSSRIIVSTTRKFCLKQIDNQSLEKFIQISNDLVNHFTLNPNSYLIRTLKIFKITSQVGNFTQTDIWVVMPCLSPNFQSIIHIFDIKGYIEGRELPEKQWKIFKFGKDSNFIKSKEIVLLKNLQKEKKKQFIKTCEIDAQFLCSKNLIDYSLLLCFRTPMTSEIVENQQIKKNTILISKDFIMEWYIIDYFQQFNLKKKTENKIKTLFLKQVSSVDPETYFHRFINFLKSVLLIEN